VLAHRVRPPFEGIISVSLRISDGNFTLVYKDL